MDLKEFSYLITLAENGSVSKAADQLFMAQSRVSFCINTKVSWG